MTGGTAFATLEILLAGCAALTLVFTLSACAGAVLVLSFMGTAAAVELCLSLGTPETAEPDADIAEPSCSAALPEAPGTAAVLCGGDLGRFGWLPDTLVGAGRLPSSARGSP